MTNSLEIQQLSQYYSKEKCALNNLNLNLNNGLVGLLGSNGAGKSSLMRILAGISQPSEGRVFWQGKNIAQSANALRQTLGYLPQSFGVYDNLSAIEFLSYLASMKQIPTKVAKQRIAKLLEQLNLSEVAHRPLREYSGGMKQRVGIIQALLNDPKLLIMDEPSTGLDPEERAGLRDLLSELADDRIIILSTHIVSDVESIADNIALLEQGKLITFSTPQQLLNELHNQVWLCKITATELTQHANNLCISNRVRQGDDYLIRLVSKQQPLAQAMLTEPCLEDAYLYFNKINQQQNDQLEQVA